MVTISKCISVFLIGIFELWIAVPTGLAFTLNPFLVVAVSTLGASTGAFLVLLLGEPLRKWLLSLKKSNLEKPNSRLKGIWDKYGIPGLCLISPLILGTPIGAAIGLTLGGKKVKIALWMTISCLLWATIFTLLGTMGVSVFHKKPG
jgi:membrane protein DedA with SNARE-associated domain